MLKRHSLGNSSLTKGFTIVELLIVIVVIGILAALALNTFSNAQRKAINIRTIANVRQYLTALKSYQTLAGYYPRTDNEGVSYVDMVCLGQGYKNAVCGNVNGSVVRESESLRLQLEDYLGQSRYEAVNDLRVDIDANENIIGATYGIDYAGDGTRSRNIKWILKGENEPCIIPGGYAWKVGLGNTACELVLEPYPL